MSDVNGRPLVLRSTQTPSHDEKPRRPKKRRGLLGTAMSVTAHLLVLAGMYAVAPKTPKLLEPGPMTVSLVPGQSLFQPVALPVSEPEPEPQPKPPTPPKAEPKHNKVKPRPPRPEVRSIPTTNDVRSQEPVAEVSDSQLASAATAESGTPGGSCNMARLLQGALRKDPMVKAAVANARRSASNKAMMVWNGDWVRNPDQDGKGLAAVREAIMWEVAFAPEACRAEPVHGLVLISLNDATASRLVVGSNEWRWTDLLHSAR